MQIWCSSSNLPCRVRNALGTALSLSVSVSVCLSLSLSLSHTHTHTTTDQDDQLDLILDGVGTLKNMSEDINQELDLHTSLLDDLDGAVDSTSRRLEDNTDRVKDVEEKEASCMPLCIIFVLLMAIIALLFVN